MTKFEYLDCSLAGSCKVYGRHECAGTITKDMQSVGSIKNIIVEYYSRDKKSCLATELLNNSIKGEQ